MLFFTICFGILHTSIFFTQILLSCDCIQITMGKRKVPDLYRAPFPLYTVKIDPNTGFIVTAGGGGASKTGIKNAVVSVWINHL